jgi:hypothetical protein
MAYQEVSHNLVDIDISFMDDKLRKKLLLRLLYTEDKSSLGERAILGNIF